jgi:hypothetical protein
VTARPASDLRAPGRLLLVSCYELGQQPLGVAGPLSFLRAAGYEPACADLAVAPLEPEAARAAGLVVVSAPMHTALRVGLEAARGVRELAPGARLLLHGHYAWLHREHLLASGLADACVAGEAEEAIAAYAEALREGAPPPASVATAAGGAQAPVRKRLRFPPPDRAGLPPLARYAGVEVAGEVRPAAALESSRGCKHRCRHCPLPAVYGGRFFAVPVERVLAEARLLVAEGARHLTFADPDFLNGPGHALRVARALHAELPEVTFDFTAKVEHLLARRGDLPELVACGALFAISAVESLSDKVLAALDKGHTRADALEVVAVARDAGLTLRPTLLPFTPWTQLEDLLDLFAWIHAGDLVDAVDPIQLSVRLLVPPGSLLLERPELAGAFGPYDPEALAHPWAHPDPRLDALQARFAARVEDDVAAKRDPAETFAALWSLACEAAGVAAPDLPAPDPLRARSPRSTEDWFC